MDELIDLWSIQLDETIIHGQYAIPNVLLVLIHLLPFDWFLNVLLFSAVNQVKVSSIT